MVVNPSQTQIRLYQTLLVSMFSNIEIMREDGTTFPIPVYINAFDQQMKRKMEIEHEEFNKVKMGLELPAISVDFLDIMFDPLRALNKMNRKVHMVFDNRRAIATYEDIPVTLNFQITIATKTGTDSYAIMEGIQSSFRNNYIKKKVRLPLYNYAEVVTPISINSITPLDELGLEEAGDREVTVNVNLSIKGIIHSYIDGRWKDVLSYYRQFKLVDTDGDGVVDSYLHPDCDGVDDCGKKSKTEKVVPIKIGSKEDTTWFKASLELLAKEQNISYKDLLSKPGIDLNTVGTPMIEKILLRLWEEGIYKDAKGYLTTINVTDQHDIEGKIK